MLILLPPSEGKAQAKRGAPVDLATLSVPALTAARGRVLDALLDASGGDDAVEVLGLSPGQADEARRNLGLRSAPAAPAGQVYTGVLYEALDANGLAAGARAWLDETAVVFSGLWGVVRLGDPIPAYRCAIGSTLAAPVGGLTAYWKKVLKKPLDRAAGGGPVLDLRSGAYAAMWSPGGPEAASVRVLHERIVDGVPRRSIVSHFNKATKGRIVRALAESGGTPGTIDEVVAALRDLKFTVEEQPAGAGRPRQLDVVVPEL